MVALQIPKTVTRRYLMCPPRHFAVSYRINPWMDPARGASARRAMRQWRHIEAAYRAAGHDVTLIQPAPGLPDMVFAANAGVVVDGRILLSKFRHPERSGEEAAFRRAVAPFGFVEIASARCVNEGEGDYLPVGDVILGGSGFRTDPRSHDEVAAFFGREVIALDLIDPRFYHLDTALAVLTDGLIAYWPGAFSPTSQGVLRERFPDAVLADEADAAAFGLNACSDGTQVVMSDGARRLQAAFHERGLATVGIDTSELQKAGGSVKCCTLEFRC
jgi:N-dimethylarginine dimethylaminohydrolase